MARGIWSRVDETDTPMSALLKINEAYGAVLVVYPQTVRTGLFSIGAHWVVDFMFEVHRDEWCGMPAQKYARYTEGSISLDRQVVMALMIWENDLEKWMEGNASE